MVELNALKEKLEKRLDTLGFRIHELEGDLRAPLNADFAEQATQMEGDEVMEELENNALAEVKQIRAALRRIDDGSYGDCSNCGDAISPGRLEALPYATQCINCAA